MHVRECETLGAGGRTVPVTAGYMGKPSGVGISGGGGGGGSLAPLGKVSHAI